jgi:hypothetical protein
MYRQRFSSPSTFSSGFLGGVPAPVIEGIDAPSSFLAAPRWRAGLVDASLSW